MIEANAGRDVRGFLLFTFKDYNSSDIVAIEEACSVEEHH